jgi:hypothetical protein
MLARKVYQKADADDKTRLKVAGFIHNKYIFYQDTNKLLSNDDLVYISHFDDQIVLSKEEKKFINDSRRKAKIVNTSIWTTVMVVFGALIWLVISNYSAWVSARDSNLQLAKEQANLIETKDSIQQLLDNTMRLENIVAVQDDSIGRSKEQLKKLAMDRKILIIQLQETNEKLKLAYAKIEGEQIDLQKEQVKLEGALKQKIVETKRANQKLTNHQKSLALSQKAQLLMASNNGRPSDTQIKQAFKLARQSWDLFDDNSQAMDVINEIKAAKISKSGSFLDRDVPKYTYTKSQIKSTINKLNSILK